MMNQAQFVSQFSSDNQFSVAVPIASEQAPAMVSETERRFSVSQLWMNSAPIAEVPTACASTPDCDRSGVRRFSFTRTLLNQELSLASERLINQPWPAPGACPTSNSVTGPPSFGHYSPPNFASAKVPMASANSSTEVQSVKEGDSKIPDLASCVKNFLSHASKRNNKAINNVTSMPER